MHFILLLAIIITVTKKKQTRKRLKSISLLFAVALANGEFFLSGYMRWHGRLIFLTGTSEVPVFSIKVKSSVGKEHNGCSNVWFHRSH